MLERIETVLNATMLYFSCLSKKLLYENDPYAQRENIAGEMYLLAKLLPGKGTY